MSVKAKVVDSTHLELSKPIAARQGLTVFVSVVESGQKDAERTGIKPIFPIWNIPTNILAEQMLSSGVEAYISCVDPRKVPGALAGLRWSEELLKEFPEKVQYTALEKELRRMLGYCNSSHLKDIRDRQALAPFTSGFRENDLKSITEELIREIYNVVPKESQINATDFRFF